MTTCTTVGGVAEWCVPCIACNLLWMDACNSTPTVQYSFACDGDAIHRLPFATTFLSVTAISGRLVNWYRGARQQPGGGIRSWSTIRH